MRSDRAPTLNATLAFKTDLIKPRQAWRTIDEVELATLEWVWWFNNSHLHYNLAYRTPNEIETAYHDS